MKTLYIMRHAKASWGEPGLEDIKRPLIEKGKKRTKNIIDYLQKKQVKPDLILSSHAVRAMETAMIMAHGLGISNENIQTEKAIYTSETERIEDVFFDIPPSINKVMIIGHNPSITGFINNFLDVKIDALPTSGVVALEFSVSDWSEIIRSSPRVKFIIYPKMLG